MYRFRQHSALAPSAVLLVALFAGSCNTDTVSVVETEARLQVFSLIAINEDARVTLGWTPPQAPSPHDDLAPVVNGDASTNPDDAGTPAGVLIYRGDEPGFTLSSATLLAEVPDSMDRYVDSTVLNGVNYYYRVVPVGLLPGGQRKMGVASTTAVARPWDYSNITEIRYSEHIQSIFNSGCAVNGCHVGGADENHDHLKRTLPAGIAHDEPPAQFSLKSWDDLMRGGSHGAVVVAYRPERSHLFFHVNNDTLLAPVSLPHMPPVPGFQLPRDQLLVLQRWIAEGCRNDAGAIPFTAFPRGRVLITNQAEDLVAVIDCGSNLAARYIRAGAVSTIVTPPEAPHNVTLVEAEGVYYVNLIGSGRVLKYRLDTNELIDSVGGIISPTQIAVSGTGDTAFVAQFAPGVNAIKILRTNPLQVIGQVSIPNLDKPHGVQITPDGRELWVTGNLSDNIMVVNLADLSTRLIQLNNQPPGEGGVLLPYQTVMTSDNKKVYVTNQRGNTVTVVDRETYAVVKSIPVGLNPLIPSITPDSRYVLVPNRNTNNLSVIDTESDSVVVTIADIGPQPHGSAITSDGRLAYVSCENVTALVPPHHPTTGSRNPGFFTVIDIATWSVVETYETGAFAAGVAISNR